jgi:hypothetical protein
MFAKKKKKKCRTGEELGRGKNQFGKIWSLTVSIRCFLDVIASL